MRNDCTLVQYIGELCRYLVNSPPHPNETKHRLRLACGNGLRPDIWDEFKTRFRIPLILEFYAATEGNVMMFNFDGKPGAIGRMPWFIENRFPVALVRFDVEKEQPVRDAEGFCIKCDPDEIGEAIGKIVNDPEKPSGRFEGYARKEESEKKILRDVFERDDAWFRTGDLMRKDENGYFYFRRPDRRHLPLEGRKRLHHGSRRSASTPFPASRDANVYGVGVSGQEGRAGMAAIVCDSICDLPALYTTSCRSPAGLCAARLPAHPQQHRDHRHLQAEEARPGGARDTIRRAFPIRFTSTTGRCALSFRSTRRITTGSIPEQIRL